MAENSSPSKISAASTLVAAAMARAEAESAKARLPFIDKKLVVTLQMARVEASMKRLAVEEETAVAISKAQVVGLRFIDKKLELKLKMPGFEASMKRLALEEEAAAALAKAESLESSVARFFK